MLIQCHLSGDISVNFKLIPVKVFPLTSAYRSACAELVEVDSFSAISQIQNPNGLGTRIWLEGLVEDMMRGDHSTIIFRGNFLI